MIWSPARATFCWVASRSHQPDRHHADYHRDPQAGRRYLRPVLHPEGGSRQRAIAANLSLIEQLSQLPVLLDLLEGNFMARVSLLPCAERARRFWICASLQLVQPVPGSIMDRFGNIARVRFSHAPAGADQVA